MKNSYNENLEGHSLQVAMIAHFLGLIENKFFDGDLNCDRLAMFAIYHDANEIITGDMPTPIKYHTEEIKKAYKDIERESKKKLIDLLPREFYEEFYDIFFFDESEYIKEKPYLERYRILVKAADKISAYIKCVEELKSGNKEFLIAEKSTKAIIHDLNIPCVNYFMETFLKGFELTLDDIKF